MGLALLNMVLAFLEGLALIASPCILPILPIILSTSISGSKKRPLGVIFGFVASFTLFTLFSRQLVLFFGLDLNIVRNISFVLLILLGVIMISSFLTEKFTEWTQGFANLGLRFSKNDKNDGFASGVIFGTLVGLIWTPCAGPILAAVIVQTILENSTLASFFVILAFGVGAAVPMLIIIIFGRLIVNKINFFQERAILIRKTLGFIIIITVLIIIFGNSLFFSSLKSTEMVTTSGMELKDGLVNPFIAPDFKDITAWINSPPLTIKQLRGKVVLIDFWDYSCINCIRTLPYLIDWYNKYHKQGFEIIGVHSPEFDFEKDLKNVQSAVKADGILYPVALDNKFVTWQNYNNLYWPAHYLIDKQGNVVYEHFGEGQYETMENNIRYLLGVRAPMVESEQIEPMAMLTPETYLGYSRSTEFYSNEPRVNDNQANYTYPSTLPEDAWALKGAWTVESQRIVSAQKNSSIKLNFRGKKVFAVMGSNAESIQVKVMLNGVMVKDQNGEDVKDGHVEVMASKLYKLIKLSKDSSGVLELIASAPGLEIYTFTFGDGDLSKY